ncbi:hypothetical protein ACFQPG_00085 [Sphingomonas sp. GCM10030256]|uniref:hypothetical protein n=1 Tax=Sphingomonas sp. GCM10030256 TaxID=3273427 RepID=UPI003608051F
MRRPFLLFAFVSASLATSGIAAEPVVQTSRDALAQDADAYAKAYALPPANALARLKAQADSVATTERLRTTYRSRLAGMYIEQRPVWRIVVLLTGTDKPADYTVSAGGMQVPVTFQAGAQVTREQVLAAIDLHRAAISSAVPGVRGVGHDPRTGRMIVMQRASAARRPAAEIEGELARLTGVPVTLRRLQATFANTGALGGSRVVGPLNGVGYVCTTGFVVTYGALAGITTAAHCPDNMTYRGPDGEERLLKFAGGWGTAYRDVQVHTGVGRADPLFFADKARTQARAVTSWRTRPMTRAGDIVCMRGESSGYNCSEVELIDFAPPAELCGGLCSASWVTVKGPECRRGDSGGPVFLGTTAYGILKGGAFIDGQRCAFYYYMSVDYLPENWRLVTRRD